MRVRFNRNVPALLCGALLIVFGSGWAIDAQGPSPAARQTVPSSPTVKKPLSYDAYDYWRSIQGTTLSRDGEWLAYALTAQGADGELVVRNLRTGTEHGIHAVRIQRSPRTASSSPSRSRKPRRTRNAIVLRRSATASPKAAVKARTKVKASRNAIRRKRARGSWRLRRGRSAIVERVGSVSMPEESSSWVAMHRGNGGAGRGGRGGRGAGGRGAPPPAGRGQAGRRVRVEPTVRRAASARSRAAI